MAENEIPKIVRGTTGQAKFVGHPWDCDVGTAPEADAECWSVNRQGGGSGNVGGSKCPEFFGIGPEGWDVDDEGVVSVPEDAMPGLYHADLYKPCEVDYGDSYTDPGALVHRYEFEVVCFKLEVGEYVRTIIN